MTLLCLSNDTKYVVTEKDIMDISSPNYTRGLYLWYIPLTTVSPIFSYELTWNT